MSNTFKKMLQKSYYKNIQPILITAPSNMLMILWKFITEISNLGCYSYEGVNLFKQQESKTSFMHANIQLIKIPLISF